MGLYFASAVIVVVTMLTFCLIHILTGHNLLVAITFLAIAMAILLAQIAMFYSLANIGASAIFFSMTFFGGSLAVVIITGGWTSPARMLFFCSPAISFLVGGRQEGFYMGTITLLSGFALMATNMTGFQALQIIRPENLLIAEACLWIISLCVLISCLGVYDAFLESYSKFTPANAPHLPLRQKSG